MNNLDAFLIPKSRPLPVIVAVDRSGSMNERGKIAALNTALKDFIASIQSEDSSRAEIQLALFSFGGEGATCDLPLAPVTGIGNLEYPLASGKTPMGDSFQKIKTLIEDTTIIPHRSYRPTIVLLSDGIPTDEWQAPVSALINTGRSAKAFRIAMALGDDADRAMLAKFVSSPEYLLSGENARDIRKFFRFVTMSVTQRLRSQSPDAPQPRLQVPEDDTLDF
jgi:uncharacterized protein YegL